MSNLSSSDEASNDLNRPPEFKPILEEEYVEKVACCTQPNYKNFQLTHVLLITVIFLVMQLFSNYHLHVNQTIGNNNSIQRQHYAWISSLSVIISLTFINVMMKHKREQFLLKTAAVLCVIGSLLTVSVFSLQMLQQYQVFLKVPSDASKVFLCIYTILATIVVSVSIAFQLVAAFCYMVKCVPKTGDKGLMVGFFLMATIVGGDISVSLNGVTLVTEHQIVTAAGVALFVVQIFFIDRLPVPNFGVTELDVSLAASAVKEHRVTQTPRSRGESTYDWTPFDQTGESGTSDFEKIATKAAQKVNTLPDEPKVDNKRQEPSQKKNWVPRWAQFYIFVLFKTTNGLLLFVQAALYAFFQSFLQSYHDVQFASIDNECSAFEERHDACWADAGFIQNLTSISTVVQCVVVVLAGYCFDLVTQHIKSGPNGVIFGLFTVISFLIILIIPIPAVATMDDEALRDWFFVGLMMLVSLSNIFLMLNLVTMFKGAYRVAVCIIFTFIYLFRLVSDVLKFAFEFLGEGYLELIIFAFTGTCWYILHHKYTGRKLICCGKEGYEKV